MKKSLFIPAFISLFLFSCKKNSPVKTPAISVSIDGKTNSFTELPIATYLAPNDLSISALTTGSLYTYDKMTLEIVSPVPITPGTYTEFASTPGSATCGYALYVHGVGYYQALGTVASSNPATITITAIDSNFVQGTFSGDVTFEGAGGSNRKVLTNGVFKVPF